MEVHARVIKKSRMKCDRCGENQVNTKAYLASPYISKNSTESLSKVWRGRTFRRIYSASFYLCYDCFIEVGKDLANNWMNTIHAIAKANPKVRNLKEIEDLKELRHERKVYVAKVRKVKEERKQEKAMVSNVGLDIVGGVI